MTSLDQKATPTQKKDQSPRFTFRANVIQWTTNNMLRDLQPIDISDDEEVGFGNLLAAQSCPC